MKKKINIAFVSASIIALIAYVVLVDGVDNILTVWRMANKWWLLCGVVAMLVYWLFEAGILHDITKSYHPMQRFRQTLRTSMIGQLFNCITPFASGGQPLQAYDMVKCGVPIGVATCSLLIKFIVYQTALTLASIVVLIFKFSEFSKEVSGFIYLVFIGFLVNFAVLAFLFCIGFFKKFTIKIVCGFIKFLGKLRIFKHVDQKLEHALVEIDEFYDGFQKIRHNKKMFVLNVLASVAQVVIYSAIPYLIYLSFDGTGYGFFDVVAAQIFVAMITAFVPLPGAIGGAEISFYMFFQIFFPSNQLNMAILLWRLLTFYFPIVMGLLFYMRSRTPGEKQPEEDELCLEKSNEQNR